MLNVELPRPSFALEDDRGLHFYRCLQCLEVFTNQEFVYTALAKVGQKTRHIADLQCVCRGQIEWMGQARPSKERLEERRRRSTCDNRCISARGPDCYCCCKCRNHGVAYSVAITDKAQKIGVKSKPVFSPEKHRDIILRVNDYKSLSNAVKMLLTRARISGSEVKAKREHYTTFEDIQYLMVFNLRISKLQTLHRELSPDGLSFPLPSQSAPETLPSQAAALDTPWALHTTISYQEIVWQHLTPKIPELTPQFLATLAKSKTSTEHPFDAILPSNNQTAQNTLVTNSNRSATNDQLPHQTLAEETEDARVGELEHALNLWFA